MNGYNTDQGDKVTDNIPSFYQCMKQLVTSEFLP